MAFQLDALLRFIHVLAASLWFGGALLMVLMVAPVVRGSGPTGRAFMGALMRAGGLGRYFGPLGLTTVVFGLILYYRLDYHTRAFDDAASSMVSIGGLLAILAMLEGLAINMPTEAKMKKLLKDVGPQGPTPEQGAQLEQLGMKIGKASLRGTIMIGLAFVLMIGRTLV